ncbi:MAG: sigma-70 family RNA polymerase sigma factor [Planctomycetaceae bacterium]|jgi:RNA polymerase primary sigma factor/RNA polymerase sigma factor|nr:sigma-70 family RNA polymerase sigma factor [Planctomycetaceae bacterium]
MKDRYQLEPLRELADQQVRFAPRDKKIEQARKAEMLCRDIADNKTYSYRFICIGITEFRTQRYAGLMFDGSKIKHDLLLFIDELFNSANASAAEFNEKVWTLNELCRRFNVSEKTISRWRKQGLIARRFVFGKKKRIGFLNESVEYFVKSNSERVRYGEKFRQLTADEKRTIITAARRSTENKPSAAVQRLARHLGRSPETVRLMLKHFDEQHSDTALFARRQPLNEDEQRNIFEAYRNGTPVKILVKKFHRTRGAIHHIINTVRAKRIAELPLAFIGGADSFTDNETPVFVEEEPATMLPGSVDEQFLFRQMNRLKFQAAQLRATLNRVHPKASVMLQIETLYRESLVVKNEIIALYLPLIVAAAKRHHGQNTDLSDLISDGNLVLLQAVETFDYRRKNRFSTYLTWAVARRFARTIPAERKQRSKFYPGSEDVLATAPDGGNGILSGENAQWEHRRQVEQLLLLLDERERNIIAARFGIGDRLQPVARKKIGIEIGITEERVRQIENAVLEKLRDKSRS